MSEVEGTDGRVLADRYRLGEVLGKGGMGTVWRAVDETLGRTVAVKELRFPGNVDEDEKQRLVTRTLREAKATARIRNTGAITVYDVVRDDDRPWIVMELVEGRSLSDAIREDGPLTPKRAAEVGLVVLDVLKAAHKEGILHRDVKPSNVLIADDGRVVLSDFGIAQIDGDPSVTSTGMLVGAPSYISPERARGQKPGPPADLWSLGALLYASVEGHPPYDKGSAIATLTAVMTEPVGPMANAGPLAEAIKGLLVKDPERRLDQPGATALLSVVAHAPERPVAPPAGDARTVVLPVDPQPTPTDAPASTLAAAADQARVRDALRSVRKAAAGAAAAAKQKQAAKAAKAAETPRPAKPPKPARPARQVRPAPEPGTPESAPVPARASITDVVPRRTLVIVVAIVVVALLGTVIGIALANSGGGKGGSSATPSEKASGKTSAPAVAGGADDKHGQDGKDGKGHTSPSGPSTPTSQSPSADPTTGPPVTPSGPKGGAAVPAGWHTVTDSARHFSIALPPGWHQTSSGSATFSASGGYPRVLIDFTSTPGKDAAARWRTNERDVGPASKNYHLLVPIAAVDYRGYPTAADWYFTRTEPDGTHTHVLNRGFVVDSTHGYAIMFSAPADAWDSAATKALRDGLYRTFQPTS